MHFLRSNFMEQAIQLAMYAAEIGEVPVAAVIVRSDEIIASEHNLVFTKKDVTAHAEINAIKMACIKLGSMFLSDCDLYVTLEPCAMCAQVLSYARIRRVYFGAYDIKSGGIDNGAKVLAFSHYKPEVYGGIMEQECKQLMQNFFDNLRNKERE